MFKNDVKYDVQLSGVQEVSVIGAADLDFWGERLDFEGLSPMVRDGHVTILICAAAGKFMGLAFRELSISVAVSRSRDGSNWDGAFLVQAFNSRPFFAFVERNLFKTPYASGQVTLSSQIPVSTEVTRRGLPLFRLAMPLQPSQEPRTPIKDAEDGFEGPIFLPEVPAANSPGKRFFYGRLMGRTQTYPVLGSDTLSMHPTSEFPVIQMLVDSHFQPKEWIIRHSATHGKSKTKPRPPQMWM